MRRRVHLPFLAAVLGLCAVLAVAVHLLHGYQMRRGARGLRDRADRALADGKPAVAADYLARYLGYSSEDTDALADYGLLLHGLSENPATARARPEAREEAFYALEQVLLREPKRAELRRRQIDIALSLARYSDAQAHTETLLKEAPTDGELHHLQGLCLFEKGHYRPAANAFAQATKHAPRQLNSYLRLAELQRVRLDQAAEADRTMDALVTANPTLVRAWLARSVYRKALALRDVGARRDLLADAAKDIAEARRLDSENAEAALADADLAQLLSQYADAARHARAATTLAPKDVRARLALTEALWRGGDVPGATAVLRTAAADFRDDPEALWRVTGLLLDLGALADARRALDALRREDNPTVEFLDAKLLTREEKWADAARALERVRPRLAAFPDLAKQIQFLLGDCQAHLGNADQALAWHTRARDLDPTWVAPRLGRAAALLAVGRVAEAHEEYRRLTPVSSEARIAAARLAIVRNLQRPEAEQQWDEPQRLLDEEDRLVPDSVEAAVVRTELLAARGDAAKARGYLERRRAAQPERIELVIALSQLLEGQGDAAGALKVLDDAPPATRGPNLFIARCGYWSRHGGDEATRALAGLAAEAEASPDRARLLFVLGEAHYHIGDKATAQRLWTALADGPSRDDLRVRQALFDLAFQSDDADAVGRHIAELRRLEGDDGVLWRFAEAAALFKKGDAALFGEAKTRLAEAQARRPGWPRPALLAARLDDRAGNHDAALQGYLRAVELGDRQPDVFRRAAELLHAQRRFADAEDLLRKLPDRLISAGGLDKFAAVLTLSRDANRAFDLARRAAPETSTEVRDHLWFGQVAFAAGKTDEAEAAWRRAVRVAPAEPDGWVALVRLLAHIGRKTDAEEETRRAEKAVAATKAPLALAACYEALERPEMALKQYEAALAGLSAPPDALRAAADFHLRHGRGRQAEALLRRLLEPATRASEGDVAAARRSLASATAAVGDYSRLPDVLALLDDNVRRHGDNDDDRRARAVLLGLIPEKRREARKLLGDCAARGALPPEHQLFLARLYERDNDWPQARDRYLAVVASERGGVSAAAAYAEALLRRGDLDEADAWTGRVAAKEPTAFRTVSLRARTAAMRGRRDDAVALLRAFDADPVRAATLLEDLGEDAAAEELYRRCATTTGRAPFLLAAAVCVARQGRADDALTVCEQAAAKCSPEEVAAAAVGVAYAVALDDRSWTRVEALVETARQRQPEGRSVPFTTANYLFLRGRLADAAALYRRLAETRPDDATVLNNLAWLLALGDGKPDEALTVVGQALARSGPLAEVLHTRGVVLLAAGRTADALKDLEEVNRTAPSAVHAFHLAQARQAARDRDGAREALATARRLGLRPAVLHPLERKNYARTLADLDSRN